MKALISITLLLATALSACGGHGGSRSQPESASPVTASTSSTPSASATSEEVNPSAYDRFAMMTVPVNAAVDNVEELVRGGSEASLSELQSACETAQDATSEAFSAFLGRWVSDDEIVGDAYEATNAFSTYASALQRAATAYGECGTADTIAGARASIDNAPSGLEGLQQDVRFFL